MKPAHPATLRRQHGLATLFVAITLLAISSLVLLASSKHLVVDQFNAQNQRRYNQALNYAEEGLDRELAALISSAQAGTTALDAEIDELSTTGRSGTHYTARLVGTAPDYRLIVAGTYDGQQVSVQRMLHRDSGGSSGGTASPLTLIGDLNLGGSVTILGGQAASFTVDGNISMNGSINGIDSLRSTGTITIGGNQTVNNLQANDDITIQNGTYQTIKTMGNIVMSGNAVVSVVKANGSGTFGNSNVGSAEIIGNVNINNGGTSMGSLKTQGNLTSNTSGTVGPVQAEGNLTISGWGGPMTATIGGTASYNQYNTNIRVTQVNGLKVPIDPVTAVTTDQIKVDANDYRSQANYAFTRDTDNNIIVTVSNVSGLADGDYRIGRNSSNHRNYLCKTVNSGVCSSGQPMVKFCSGYSDYNDCLSVNNSGTWSLNGTTMAPGILWFDGAVTAGNGTYYNTIIATGNISTSGSHVLYAPNYAGYSTVCTNTGFTLRPANLCDFTNSKLLELPTANIAYLSGAYKNGSYTGGDITLGASNHVYGSVIAGNHLNTGGSTTVHGYVSAGRCDSISNGSCVKPAGLAGHTWNGSTTIDLRNLPSSFTPGNTGTSGSGSGATITTVAAGWIDSGL